ncbi:IS200/IS605 family transposase [Laribacter hongkongensis]|uniref:IS200/IS605 family transposase n=1 Tax=Laribacter hongkongensis TaxID=168471 RepID=UPI001EFEE07B|nr:IS200/IS605 family transposase [Laribacter hongkongensis]MCG9065140.1 IS200/IS605 family transposase [Laribacter hongkongensis]
MDAASLKTCNHSAFRLYYHLVLSMKYRHKCLTPAMLDRLEALFRELLVKWSCELIEFGGEADYVHVLFEANPTIRPSDLVKNLKSVTARHMRKDFTRELAPYYWKPLFWNNAYALISVGGRANIETLLRYIENQNDPRKQVAPPLD